MMNRSAGYIAALLLLAVVPSVYGQGAPKTDLSWYRGNTHVHTMNNDGNLAPDGVTRWYREHGYQFVFITDHEFLTDVAPLNALFGAEGRFLVLPGQEVTQVLADESLPGGLRHAHVNGLGSTRLVMPIGSEGNAWLARGTTMAATFERNVAAIRAAGGIPQINHPVGFVKAADLRNVPSPFLLEVWNGHPTASNLGGRTEQGEWVGSAEELWDMLLSQGKVVWAVGTDDAHDYVHLDDLNSERPGKAWITVRAAQLTAQTILAAIRKGEFYASNGVYLEDYSADRTSISIALKQPPGPRNLPMNRLFTTKFVGQGGRVLAEVGGLKPTYRIRGDEGYVRASILDSNGARGWTQPVFLDGRGQ